MGMCSSSRSDCDDLAPAYAGRVSTTLTHDADARRYVLRNDDDLVAALDYAENDSSVFFTHTFTAPALRGRGHAATVVAFAVADVERAGGKRIVPACWYAADWFAAHPERAGLLTRGQ